jgi:hypothetical protein
MEANMMVWILGALVLLVGSVVAMLVALYVRMGEAADWMAADFAEQRRVAEQQQQSVAKRAKESAEHRDAMGVILGDEIRRAAGVIVGEIRRESEKRRELLEQVSAEMFPLTPKVRDGASPADRGRFRHRRKVAQSPPEAPKRLGYLPPDAPTPKSGYSVPALLSSGDGEGEGTS